MSSFTSILRGTAILLAAMFCASCAELKSSRSHEAEIHQVGLVWLKRPGNEEDRRKITEAVHQFGREIPAVKRAVVGRTDGIGGIYSDTSYDLCFILTFADEPARQRYNAHPVHQRAASEAFLPLSKRLMFYRFVSE